MPRSATNKAIREWISFERSTFLRITTLLTWFKSTLLLKNKCFDTAIYMKTQCLQTNKTQHYWKGKCLSRERVALIKSLIYARWKETLLRHGCQIELKMPADKVKPELEIPALTQIEAPAELKRVHREHYRYPYRETKNQSQSNQINFNYYKFK